MSGDTQAVLATDKIRFQGQEIAAVVATDPYIAEDVLELIDVDYEILPAVTTPQQSLADGTVLIRDDCDSPAATAAARDQGPSPGDGVDRPGRGQRQYQRADLGGAHAPHRYVDSRPAGNGLRRARETQSCPAATPPFRS